MGFAPDQFLRLNREIGIAASHAAAAMLDVAGEALLQPGEGEHQLAHRFALAAEELLPMAGAIARYAVQEHLRAQLGRTAITTDEVRAGRTTNLRQVSVLFVDVVGFTALGERFGPALLGDIADRLAAIAAGAARPPVTLVKTIGDAAMLVAPEPEALLEAAVALLAAAGATDPPFPPLRGGVAGGLVLARNGDWYGEPVNLASRLCDLALPGTILVTTAVKDGCPTFHWEPAGTKPVKGLPGPVELWSTEPTRDSNRRVRA